VEGARSILVEHLIDEKHHRSCAQPWILGRTRFEFLLAQGLQPRDRVLDFGCGAGRVGVWLIAYLEPGRYFGIDAHLRSLVAFSAYEIRLHGLEAKRPRLLHDADFRFDHFGERFDVVIDSSVSRHLSDDRFRQALAQLPQVLAPGGRVFSEHLAPDRLEYLRGAGFESLREVELDRPLQVAQRHREHKDTWQVLRLA
jgi:SAM-dependent methyltransferase